jgi:hypothetical protein
MAYSGPQDTLKDREVFRELQEVARSFEEIPRMKILFAEPFKPRAGNFCICDGTTWNPLGDGIKRPVWFDGTNWQAF